MVRLLSDIERVHVDVWRNPDQTNRIVAGSVPIGDYEIQPAGERHVFESFQGDTEPYDFWGDAPVEKARKGRRKK